MTTTLYASQKLCLLMALSVALTISVLCVVFCGLEQDRFQVRVNNEYTGKVIP
jgi:hypothetical protein